MATLKSPEKSPFDSQTDTVTVLYFSTLQRLTQGIDATFLALPGKVTVEHVGILTSGRLWRVDYIQVQYKNSS